MWDIHRPSCPRCTGRQYFEDLCDEGRQLARLAQEELRERTGAALATVPASGGSLVLARAESGASVLVPLEKGPGSGVVVRTSPDVVLRLPERDVSVYEAMRQTTHRLLALADRVSRYLGEPADEEGRQLYLEVARLEREVLEVAERAQDFMHVDRETRRVIRAARVLGVSLRGELERQTRDRKIRADEGTRKLARLIRMLAIDLQGEKERRLGG